MKRTLIGGICVLILLTFIPVQRSSERGFPTLTTPTSVPVTIKTTYFDGAYATMRKNEGNYAWLKNDFGGETYGGITRNFNPKWAGWSHIDSVRKSMQEQYKLKHPKSKYKIRKLNQNQYVSTVEPYVKEFYHDWWSDWQLDQIQDSLAAVHTFDFAIGGYYSVCVIQRTLNKLGENFKVDGRLGIEECQAINKYDPVIYLETLRVQRREFYTTCANRWHKTGKRDSNGKHIMEQTQKGFLKGWLYRADKVKPVLQKVLEKRKLQMVTVKELKIEKPLTAN